MNDETSSSLQLCYINHVQPINLFHCEFVEVFLWAKGLWYFEDVNCLFSLECELVLEAQDSLETHKDMHTILTISHNTIEYNPQPNGPHTYINTKPNTHEYYASTSEDPPPPPRPPKKLTTNGQHLGTLLHICENQPHTTHTRRIQSQIHKTMANNPQHYTINLS